MEGGGEGGNFITEISKSKSKISCIISPSKIKSHENDLSHVECRTNFEPLRNVPGRPDSQIADHKAQRSIQQNAEQDRFKIRGSPAEKAVLYDECFRVQPDPKA